MAEVEVKDLKNKVVGKVDLADEVFAYEARKSLVWEAIRAFQAGRRKGTHATKNRSATAGGGRKPWRQKGTGRARAGTMRSPLWAGGGTTHGPAPRDYSQALPRKKRRGAVKLVLSDKLKNGQLLVVDDLTLESHKTKDFAEILKKLDLGGKVLVVDVKDNRNLYLSSRNLPAVKMVSANGLNVYDLVNHPTVLISKPALMEVQEALQR
jgi:large subunit ribosomal protein L4